VADSQVLLSRTTGELEEMIKNTMDQLLRIRRDQKSNLEIAKRTNLELSSKISSARKEMNRLLQERASLQRTILQAKQKPALDEQRLKVLMKQHKEQREKLQDYHNGYGWQTEVFRSVAGNNTGVASLSKLLSRLKDWLCVESTDWCNDDLIQRLLLNISGGTSYAGGTQAAATAEDDEDKDELVIIPAAKQFDRIEEIDLSAFCQLCDQLIILLER
jgi:hypothetical protein